MRRGEIWWVNFDPKVGGEIGKRRPAVIVSNNMANKYSNRLQVIPLSSQIAKIYPSEVLVTVDGKQAKAMADQLTTVSKLRLDTFYDTLSSIEMSAIENVIRLQLGL